MLKIVEKKGVVDVWPWQNEHIKCDVCAIETPDVIFESTLHKSEVDLIEKLTAMQKALRLQPATMNELWEKIEEYGQRKYEEGSNDEQASNDGEDV